MQSYTNTYKVNTSAFSFPFVNGFRVIFTYEKLRELYIFFEDFYNIKTFISENTLLKNHVILVIMSCMVQNGGIFVDKYFVIEHYLLNLFSYVKDNNILIYVCFN